MTTVMNQWCATFLCLAIFFSIWCFNWMVRCFIYQARSGGLPERDYYKVYVWAVPVAFCWAAFWYCLR